MTVVSMKHLLEAGVHFGHQTRRWNPKMEKYIFTERNGIYIIDLQQTLALIEEAYNFIRNMVGEGGELLFVGTKKQAQEAIKTNALRCGMPYVTNRWLGGTLTNWSTISRRIVKLKELEQMEESGEIDEMPKKQATRVRHQLAKLRRNLEGLRGMERLPRAVFIIDPRKEHIALMETRKIEIPVIAVVDTNCDPDLVDYVIPGNDDAIRAANLISKIIANAVLEGLQIRDALQAAAEKEREERAAQEKAEKEKRAAEKSESAEGEMASEGEGDDEPEAAVVDKAE
ncbi:MAG: 30S ribosomal protein S2 [Actinomycetota bacterium]|nr:30S ribosomal protein S2 [Actinomycetota bacterium]